VQVRAPTVREREINRLEAKKAAIDSPGSVRLIRANHRRNGSQVYEEDRKLVRRMLAGDQRAYDDFFNHYARRLATFAARRSSFPPATVEDIVQTTLIKALRSLANFRADSALFTWLCEICRREIINVHRQTARRPQHESFEQRAEVPEVMLELRGPELLDPSLGLELRQHRSAIAKTLNALPERYARALEWKYGDGFSVEEIATMMGVTTTAAQSLLARARLAFKEEWGQELA
jgi:RNA polymerase sigma-70 factor, ECF subfamily